MALHLTLLCLGVSAVSVVCTAVPSSTVTTVEHSNSVEVAPSETELMARLTVYGTLPITHTVRHEEVPTSHGDGNVLTTYSTTTTTVTTTICGCPPSDSVSAATAHTSSTFGDQEPGHTSYPTSSSSAIDNSPACVTAEASKATAASVTSAGTWSTTYGSSSPYPYSASQSSSMSSNSSSSSQASGYQGSNATSANSAATQGPPGFSSISSNSSTIYHSTTIHTDTATPATSVPSSQAPTAATATSSKPATVTSGCMPHSLPRLPAMGGALAAVLGIVYGLTS